MNGVPVTPPRTIGTSEGRRVVRIRIGSWPSGLYFARLRATDGRVGFAPFVVRPRRLGEHDESVTKTRLLRDLGRPEASLIGVQYLANGKAPRQPWIVRQSRAGS